MSAPEEHQSETSLLAEKALSAALGGTIHLEPRTTLDGSNRSNVLRCAVIDAPGGLPATVIVKRAAAEDGQVYDPEEPGGSASRIFNDWAGLEFLGKVAKVAGSVPICPRIYAGDREAGLIIMEDIADGQSLDSLLLGDDAVAAENALIKLGATLGKLHAITVGKEAEYEAIRGKLGPRKTELQGDTLVSAFHDAIRALNLVPGPALEQDLALLRHSLRNPGPLLAYSHGDPCPGNGVLVGDHMVLFDFETGDFRHALLDGVYGRIHFPTCWCVNRLPEQLPLRMETAYRAELVKGCPQAAEDDLFYKAVVEACVAWAITLFQWVPTLLAEDKEWGISTGRQRVLLRFAIAADVTAEFNHLLAFGEVVRKMAAKLRILWPAEADAMPYYPAFR
jgi:hypothetical protein